MAKTGTAELPLHSGSAPRWLFDRMEKLGRAVSEAVIEEYGQEELVKRLSDPYWFQALGCVLGFDWHSSGLTTTTMGALKEALELEKHGVRVAGGKGNTSRKTPSEIESSGQLNTSRMEELKQVSRTSASVDNSCVQDSYTLYHHTLVFTENGDWSVVQQGMNDSHARRYHWHSDDMEDAVEEPQSAICSERREKEVLDLVARNAGETREIAVDLVNDDPRHLERFTTGSQSTLARYSSLEMPDHHILGQRDLSRRSIRQLQKAYEVQPRDFEELLNVKGIGKKSLRSLALIAELVYGSENSWEDPAKYAYTHGGKDGTPFPVDRELYDENIDRLEKVVSEAEMERNKKKKAMKRLQEFTLPQVQ